MKAFEDHCQVFQFYFRCKGKLQTGVRPESGVMQFIVQRRAFLLPIVKLVTQLP